MVDKSNKFKIYCYDLNKESLNSKTIKYNNTIYVYDCGDLNISEGDNFFITNQFIDINIFYFIYMKYCTVGVVAERETIGLGTSENNKKNIPLTYKMTEVDVEGTDCRGENYWGIKVLNKDEILYWMGEDFRVMKTNEFCDL